MIAVNEHSSVNNKASWMMTAAVAASAPRKPQRRASSHIDFEAVCKSEKMKSSNSFCSYANNIIACSPPSREISDLTTFSELNKPSRLVKRRTIYSSKKVSALAGTTDLKTTISSVSSMGDGSSFFSSEDLGVGGNHGDGQPAMVDGIHYIATPTNTNVDRPLPYLCPHISVGRRLLRRSCDREYTNDLNGAMHAYPASCVDRQVDAAPHRPTRRHNRHRSVSPDDNEVALSNNEIRTNHSEIDAAPRRPIRQKSLDY